LFASGILGAIVVFGRRLRIGQRVEIAGRRGRVRELNLLEIRLTGDDGGEVRIPHLLSLWHPLRVMSERPRLSLEFSVDPAAPPAQVRPLLLEAARALGDRASAELVDLHADAGRYRVEVSAGPAISHSDLRIALASALQAAGVGLGRPPR
jgi:hypothetical protein